MVKDFYMRILAQCLVEDLGSDPLFTDEAEAILWLEFRPPS
jgi:hypothetical protein